MCTQTHACMHTTTHAHTHPPLPAQAPDGGHRRDNRLLTLIISACRCRQGKVSLPVTVEGGRSQSLRNSPAGAGVQARMPSLHPHPTSFSPGWFRSRTISFGSRDSPVPDSPAFLTGTKSPVLLRTLPKASGARALCHPVSGVGSFWR